jgi:hypothetical protein
MRWEMTYFVPLRLIVDDEPRKYTTKIPPVDSDFYVLYSHDLFHFADVRNTRRSLVASFPVMARKSADTLSFGDLAAPAKIILPPATYFRVNRCGSPHSRF